MAEEICIRVGKRIRMLRTQKQWSQAMLADHAALAREHVSELENGNKEIGLRALERIIEALGVSFTDFFSGL